MSLSKVVGIALAFACASGCYTGKPTSPPPDPGDPGPPSVDPVSASAGSGSVSFAHPPARTLPDHPPLCQRADCPTTAPAYPTQRCADGVHTGGRGPCVRFPDGRCGWIHLVCPAHPANACAGCGLPSDAEWTCPDRTRGAFECVLDASGGCGVTYRACRTTSPPTTAGGGSAQQSPPPSAPPSRDPHPCSPLPDRATLMTWPVQSVCAPGGGPAQPDRTVVASLPDGTDIVESLGRCMRVSYRKCYTKCLPPDALIATPSGDVPIAKLRVGMAIWTQDASGRRIAGHVVRTSSTAVPGGHHVARLVLADGRTLVVSPEHPAIHDRVQDLRAGELYDGATIVTLEMVPYGGERTYDILPSGGVYWADGVPLRSTLE